MLKIKEKHHYACSVKRKSLALLTILLNARKKSLLNLAKILQYKLSRTFARILQ